MKDENPIIAEIRETRERMLAEHGGDLNRLIDELQRASTQVSNSAEVGSSAATVKTPAKMVG